MFYIISFTMAHRAVNDECTERSKTAYVIVSNTVGDQMMSPLKFAIMCAEYRIKIYHESGRGEMFDFPNPGNDSESDELKEFHVKALNTPFVKYSTGMSRNALRKSTRSIWFKKDVVESAMKLALGKANVVVA